MIENSIYTIGYSRFEIDDIVATLKHNDINSLIDVRSKPYSSYRPEYNKENLKLKLSNNDIIYRNYAKEFGAIQTNRNYFTDGILDFNKFYTSKEFIEGYNKILAGIKKGYKFVFMCSEKDPSTCHRNIMVARYFYRQGFQVHNIWDNGDIELQDSLEERLLDQYFPKDYQLNFFNNETKTKSEKIEESYLLRNREIGFKWEEER